MARLEYYSDLCQHRIGLMARHRVIGWSSNVEAVVCSTRITPRLMASGTGRLSSSDYWIQRTTPTTASGACGSYLENAMQTGAGAAACGGAEQLSPVKSITFT